VSGRSQLPCAARLCFPTDALLSKTAERFSVDALPPRSSSLVANAFLSRLLGRMFYCLEVFIYGYTSLLATNVLSYFVLDSVT